MRSILIALCVCSTLLACDTQNTAKLARPDNGSSAASPLNDAQDTVEPSAQNLLRVSPVIISASADGAVVDLDLIYSLDPAIRPALQPDSYVQFEFFAAGKKGEVVARSAINNELHGTVSASIPTTNEAFKLIATVAGLSSGMFGSQSIEVDYLTASRKRDSTDLSLVGGVNAELVKGSYESDLINGRRVHKFAVKVFDPTAGPILEVLSEADKPFAKEQNYSISGLENNASKYFTAYEANIHDGESPVTVAFTEHPLAVYLVLDGSKSVVDSRLADKLESAASTSVIQLSDSAEFDYRKFNGQVTRINSMREMDFDTGDSSATALYYAIDTALSDIEHFGSIDQDKVIMVFTDGKDLASRNYYNGELIDHDQVLRYIEQRVAQVRLAQQSLFGRQLDVYTIGFYDESTGIDIAAEVMKLNRIAKAGGTKESYNNLSIEHPLAGSSGFNTPDVEKAFEAVVKNIKGVYYLQYSSQQTPDDNKLCLKVSVNGYVDWIQLQNEHEPVECDPALAR